MDILSRCTYKELLIIRKTKIKKIYLVKDLCQKGCEEIKLCGLTFFPGNTIYIDSDQDRDGKIKTLIHELLHHLFTGSKEWYIRRVEDILWTALSFKEKNRFEKMIPKRISKRGAI